MLVSLASRLSELVAKRTVLEKLEQLFRELLVLVGLDPPEELPLPETVASIGANRSDDRASVAQTSHESGAPFGDPVRKRQRQDIHGLKSDRDLRR